MENLDDKDLLETEAKIKEEFNAIEVKPFEELMTEIRPRLKKKRKQGFYKSSTFVKRFVAIVVSIVLVFGIGLTVWLTWPTKPLEYKYEDDVDIEIKICQKSNITDQHGVYLPDLNIITMEESYAIATHKESLETVYFVVEGMSIDEENGIARRITMTVILQKKYEFKKEKTYSFDQKTTVNGIEISYAEEDLTDPFYNYKIGFKIGDVRYYIYYQTSSEQNDIQEFMGLFLK